MGSGKNGSKMVKEISKKGKLIIQIPCYNEEETLPLTLNDLPREIPGIGEIETLIIDDGSTDNTIEIARQMGADHILKFTQRKGLVHAFKAGIDECLRLGADIIVNTDGDNQYYGADIAKLTGPILAGEADIVIGDRNVESIRHFSFIKRKLQRLGSWVVRRLSGTDVVDTTSGFRAYSREAALQMNIISTYTYTLETIIQSGKKQLLTKSVSVRTNEKTRESRLIRSISQYISRSIITIIRVFLFYHPLKSFFFIGGTCFVLGIIAGCVYLILQFYLLPHANNLASLILCAILLIMGFNLFMMGLLADLIGCNRKLIEDITVRIKRLETTSKKESENT